VDTGTTAGWGGRELPVGVVRTKKIKLFPEKEIGEGEKSGRV